jgi:hypothetical protein
VSGSAVPAPEAQPSTALLTPVALSAIETRLLTPGPDLEKTAGSASL